MTMALQWCETLPRPEDLPGTLRVYSRFGRPTSIVSYQHKTVYKKAKPMGGLSEAAEATEAWKSLGFKGYPSSPSGFFREAWIRNGPRQKTRQIPGIPGVRGGWCETFRAPGPVRSELKEYDLNKAYLSGALCEGFPVWSRFVERWTSRSFMLWFRMDSTPDVKVEPSFPTFPSLPRFLRVKKHRHIMLTPEQWEIWGPLDATLIGSFEAVGRSDSGIPDVMATLDGKLPDWTWNRLLSSFWGAWLPTRGLADETWRDGEKVSYRRMGSDTRVCNPAWAERVVDNVIVRMYHEIKESDPVLVHVDNVVVEPAGLTVSDRVGDWKVKRDLPRGIYLESSGVWHDDPTRAMSVDRHKWVKHAGYAAVRTQHDQLVASEVRALAGRAAGT